MQTLSVNTTLGWRNWFRSLLRPCFCIKQLRIVRYWLAFFNSNLQKMKKKKRNHFKSIFMACFWRFCAFTPAMFIRIVLVFHLNVRSNYGKVWTQPIDIPNSFAWCISFECNSKNVPSICTQLLNRMEFVCFNTGFQQKITGINRSSLGFIWNVDVEWTGQKNAFDLTPFFLSFEMSWNSI